MDGRRAIEIDRVPDTVPRVRREARPLPRSWAVAVGAGWPALFLLLMALTPPPSDPNAVPSFIDTAIFFAVTTGLIGTIVCAIGRQSKALAWSAGLAVLWLGTTIACPVSGHHDHVGWVWFAELGASASLLAASAAGIRRYGWR
jgi:hypothetical protein